MKKFLVPILVGIILGAAGFFIGQTLGYDKGYQNCEFAYQYRSIEEIKQELKIRESEISPLTYTGKQALKKGMKVPYFKLNMCSIFLEH